MHIYINIYIYIYIYIYPYTLGRPDRPSRPGPAGLARPAGRPHVACVTFAEAFHSFYGCIVEKSFIVLFPKQALA